LFDELRAEEKAGLTAGASMWRLAGVPRLGLRGLKMSDGPSGVRGATFTRRSLVLPCGAALGATWNPELLEAVGRVLGEEARDKDVDVLLGPTVNIVRTPLAGRSFECFSEDPCLSSALAVAYIGGVQSQGVGCCIKHFACNDQEYQRMTISAEVDAQTLREIHLPVFEAAVGAGVWAVMSAYNRLGGTYCSEHPVLLGAILRQEWGFDGVVVSDWFGTHSTAAALAGLDIEMPGPATWLGPVLARAIEEGTAPQREPLGAALDDMARRVLLLMERTGASEPGRVDRPEGEADVPERRAVARRAAAESIVLLTNNGLLPLDVAAVARVAVIGPNAVRFEVGGGGSATVNPHRVNPPLDALRARLASLSAGGDVEVVYEPGCQISTTCPTVEPRLLEGGGFSLELWDNVEFSGPPAARQQAAGGRLLWLGPPAEGVTPGHCSARAHTTFTPDRGGRWRFSLESAGRSRLWLDATALVDNWEPTAGTTFMGLGSVPVEVEVELVAGRPYRLAAELRVNSGLPLAGVRIGATPVVADDALEAAVAAAATADVAIVVVGTSPDHESEGFDRSTLALPGEQDQLVARVAAANPRTVVVINTGAPVTLPWVELPAAIVATWFPGEEGADALADVLLGVAEPSGRLPVTFPRRIEDTPAFEARRYPGEDGRVYYEERTGVGYRHYDATGITALFPFGHGLSYTEFRYGQLRTEPGDGGGIQVRVDVANVGGRTGITVAQCYLRRGSVVASAKQLRAFAKVELAAGARTEVVFDLPRRAFAHWDPAGGGWVVPAEVFEVLVGASSCDIRASVNVSAPEAG